MKRTNAQYLSLKFYKWSELELNDFLSRIHVPLNNIGRSVGFCMIYESLDDACDDGENPENLIKVKVEDYLHSNKSTV